MKDTLSLLKDLMRLLINLLNLSSSERGKLLEKTCLDMSMIEFITSFINGKNIDFKFKKQKANNDTKRFFLLVLDNIEGIIRDDQDNFYWFLYRLDQDCLNLKVIFTSYRAYPSRTNLFHPYA